MTVIELCNVCCSIVVCKWTLIHDDDDDDDDDDKEFKTSVKCRSLLGKFNSFIATINVFVS